MQKSLPSGVGLFVALAVLSCLQAEAQPTCQQLTAVKTWNGSYNLQGVGSGSVGGESITVNHTMMSSVTFSGPTGTCSQLVWTGSDSSSSGSLNDTATLPPGTQTLTGSGSNQVPPPQLTLTIDATQGTYTFSEGFGITGTLVTCAPGGCEQVTQDFAVEPLTPMNWPQPPYNLPLSGLQLKGTTTFSGQPVEWGISIPWTLTWTFTPVINDDQDDPCKKDGGSSIGCQNQSLGEDVPVVGTGFFLHYEGERAPGRAGANGVATTDAQMIGGWTLNVHHAYDPGSNTLFLGDGGQRSAWQFGPPVMYNGDTLITPEDGSEIYAFSGTTGQHIQTLKPLTGAVKYQFVYDAAGNLITVTDASGNVTTIQRDPSERATAIVSPFSQTTTLSPDSNNFLSQVTDPAGLTAKFTNTSGGLITGRTDSNGNVYNYSYDSQGQLTLDSDPAGGSTSISRTDSGSGYSVTTTTALGRTSTFQVTTGVLGEEFTNTWPDSLQATMTNTQQNGQLSEKTTLPDGITTSGTLGPDPRWGLQAPIPASGTKALGNLTMTTSGSRTATLGTQGDPFSLTTQTDIETINGRTYKSVFTSSNKAYVSTSPAKRITTTVLDSLERPSSMQIGALLPVKFAYDSHGRLSTITQSTRTTTLTYDANGFLASSTDPLNLTTSLTHDADGRLLSTTLPDSRVISYTYDANGNLTSVTPPGKSAHDFSYTVVDLLSVYTPPVVSGTGATNYAYNVDRDPPTITRPDGQTINFAYDNAGRLSSTSAPTETTTYAYDPNSGNLSSASISGSESLAYGYNGPLPTSSALSGTVAGTVSRTYNNNFWVASQSLNNGNTVNFTYDNDGLLTKAGAMVVKRDPKDGFVTGTTLGGALDTFKYDTFGEPTGYTAKYKVGLTITTLDAVAYTLDADGRIGTKTETIGGKKTTYSYTYDQVGRLTTVKQNGTAFSSYTYDSNSNRLSATTSSGTVTGTYDAQDRLLTYGNASFTYTANGELASQMVGSQTSSYAYDTLGNLTAVTLPSGTKITYVIDAENHRVGKAVNGTLQAGFLYDGDRIVAQLNASNQIVSQFVYGTSSTNPDYMVNGGATYRIVADQLGSPRLVVNTMTGAIAERIDYDEFGNVLRDTNPGFQPFGFASGLYDQDTRLVRFGARDYNSATGRWTVKDPVLFHAGDTNLYGYVLNDPVNLIDPAGLEGEDCSACKDVAKKVGWKAIKMELKTFDATADERTAAIQRGMVKATVNPSVREYLKLEEEQQKREDDSVDPFTRSLRKLWRTCANALTGN
jgi:RHS repeat-associated protein